MKAKWAYIAMQEWLSSCVAQCLSEQDSSESSPSVNTTVFQTQDLIPGLIYDVSQ